MIPESTQAFTPERQRYAVRKGIEKIRQEVSIADYLQALGVEVKRNRARCIVHGGDNPASFSIDPDQGLWHCFSCGEGGDLITLCELVERHVEPWTAMVSLAEQFGVELPRRPERWFARQGEKDWKRDELRNVRARHYQRRFLRMFSEDLALIEDRAEREEAARAIYADLHHLATACAINREGAKHG